MKRVLLLAAGTVGLVLAAAAPAATAPAATADPVGAAVAALRSADVYRGAPAPRIDPSALGGSTLDGVKVAILPAGPPEPVAAARAIGDRLDPDSKGLTVLVFEGTAFGAASSARCGVGAVIADAVAAHEDELRSTDDVTSTVRDFATALRKAPSASGGCQDNSTGSEFGDAAKPSDGGSHTALVVVLVLVALLVVGVALWLRSRRRRRARELSDARAAVIPYYDRLAADLNFLDGGEDRTARQALADAAERFTSAGAQLAGADSVEKYAIARRTTLEGLYAARTARRALGLDPGPDLPPITDGEGPHLDRPQEVTVQGQTFQGYPAYTPGAPYFFGGGYGVPGGWYSFPFWETLLVGSMLSGGFGGWGLGGYDTGYDTGYGSGYDAGYAAGDDAGDGGGDGADAGWGDSGGGGDWGGGGGDWGGDSGGNGGGGSW